MWRMAATALVLLVGGPEDAVKGRLRGQVMALIGQPSSLSDLNS